MHADVGSGPSRARQMLRTASHLLVLDGRGRQVHIPLTLFASQTGQQLLAGSARGYRTALLPFITEVERAHLSGEAGFGWELEPRAVRRFVADYLNDRYACLVRQHRVGFQLVAPTASTRSGVGLFLAALKFFYRRNARGGHLPARQPADRSYLGHACTSAPDRIPPCPSNA